VKPGLTATLALTLGLHASLAWAQTPVKAETAASALAGEAVAEGCIDAQGKPAALPVGPVYVLGDSIAYGLARDRLILRMRKRFGVSMQINFDAGRSITQPGLQSKTSALEGVEKDAAVIAQARVVVVILGTNQTEASFANSQQALLWRLRDLAPQADYFWVDIGATVATQAASWSERNRLIYDNAASLGYRVISRYRAIFGPQADPLAIEPGQNFPGIPTEEGYGTPGNVHGAYPQLAQAVVQALVNLGLAGPAGQGLTCQVASPP
jgi:hypothetical protein